MFAFVAYDSLIHLFSVLRFLLCVLPDVTATGCYLPQSSSSNCGVLEMSTVQHDKQMSSRIAALHAKMKTLRQKYCHSKERKDKQTKNLMSCQNFFFFWPCSEFFFTQVQRNTGGPVDCI